MTCRRAGCHLSEAGGFAGWPRPRLICPESLDMAKSERFARCENLCDRDSTITVS
jgi:hypothetical protein